MNSIGIDLGGTKIEGVLLDEVLNEKARLRIDTDQQNGYEAILSNIKVVYDKLLESSVDKDVKLGVCTPGAISKATGLLKNSNTVCLNEKPFAEDLGRLLERPFQIENDANCFAMAEALRGAGVGHTLVFGVIMGTGCGGGIVYDEKLIRGKQQIAGEWGHSVLDPNGPECYCGQRGCVETYISGGGLQKQWFEETDASDSVQGIAQKSREGDEKASEFLNRFYQNFGRAMANLINVLDPDIIVMGGGLSNLDELYQKGVSEVRDRIFSDQCEVSIVKNQLGDSAGVVGAALIGV